MEPIERWAIGTSRKKFPDGLQIGDQVWFNIIGPQGGGWIAGGSEKPQPFGAQAQNGGERTQRSTVNENR